MDVHPENQSLEECNGYLRPYRAATGFSSPRGRTTYPHWVSIENGPSGSLLAAAVSGRRHGLTEILDPFATHRIPESLDPSYSLPWDATLVNTFLPASLGSAADLD